MTDSSKINTYHCLCSTLLLATPCTLSALPRRASPSLDRAHILPLPALSHSSRTGREGSEGRINVEGDATSIEDRAGENEDAVNSLRNDPLPSLLAPALRPTRKLVVVRREDGFEKRRVYRCGRCGLSIGYEIEGETAPTGVVGSVKGGRIIYLLEGGLVATEDMGKDDG